MVHSTAEEIEYIIHLARRVPDGDVSTATLMLLMELDFPDSSDSFESVRKLILFKMQNLGSQMTEIYHMVSRDLGAEVDAIETGLRSSISTAWKNKDETKWEYFFPQYVKKDRQPSNKEFVSHIAYVMELWVKCKKEVNYAAK